MDAHDLTTAVFTRALGLDPMQPPCSSLVCEFDAADVAHLRALRDRMDSIHPDIAEILDRHLMLVGRARSMLENTPEAERWLRHEAVWPLPLTELPDFTACCDYLSDVLPAVFSAFENEHPDERMRTARAVTKAVFLELAACVAAKSPGETCPAKCNQACVQRRRHVLLDLAASKTLHSGDFDGALHVITEVAAHALGASRVVVRLLQQGGSSLVCANAYDAGQAAHVAVPPVVVAEYPVPFSTLLRAREQSLCVPGGGSQALDGQRGTLAMAAVCRWGDLAGTLDVEWATGGEREPDDLHFVAAVAQLVGIALEARARRENSEMMRVQVSALEAIPSAVAILDPGGHLLWANSALRGLTGQTLEELTSGTQPFLAKGEAEGARARVAWDMILAGRPWQGEVSVWKCAGVGVERHWQLTPLRDIYGKVTHIIAAELHPAYHPATPLPARRRSYLGSTPTVR